MSVIDEVKSRIDIVDLVSESVQLRRTGKNYTGFCPFHQNSRTPAFVVFPESGTWRCFGQCNEGGDIFRFMMKKQGWDFPEALRALAEKAGVTLTPLTPERQAEEEEHERLRGLLEAAVIFFRHHLTNTPDGKEALAYLHKRGLTDATIESFGLGYAPNSWDSLTTHFTGKGYTAAELLEVGLVTERQSGEGVYDRFRHRVIFPIRDGSGRMTGFGGRILDPEDVPKFLNSPQTILFDKGHLLYGLDQARKAIRAVDQVVIVEGYLDVIALHQGGFRNAVSPMGTALTDNQLHMLKRLTRRIVLALDPDAAGQKATLRGLQMAREAMDHSAEIGFDPRGLLRSEARLDADLRVTTLPEGLDPDEIVLRDPEEWKRIIEMARPVVVHVMETLAAGQDLEDARVKSDIAAQVLPLIEDIPGAVERDTYRQRLARLLRVDERSLVGSDAAARPARRRKNAQPRPAVTAEERSGAKIFQAARPEAGLETHILKLLLRQPEAVYMLNRGLQQAGVSRFAAQDFEQADHQMLAEVILRSLEQQDLDTGQYIQEKMPDPLRDLAHDLLQPIAYGEPTPEKARQDLIKTVMRLREIRTRAHVDQLKNMQLDLQQENAAANLEDFQSIHQVLMQCLGVLKSLEKGARLTDLT